MATERKKREIQDLIQHLHKHKDAVLILGEKLASELEIKNISDEEGENIFNRKSWMKNPQEFWKYYLENIHMDPSSKETPKVYKDIDRLLSLGLIKGVYSMNTHGICKEATNVKGTGEGFKCSKCGTYHSKEELEEQSNELVESINTLKCKSCNASKIRPTCLMYGENYFYKEMKEMLGDIFLEKEAEETLPNTHTVIYLGVDMDEDLMGELIDNYVLVRDRIEEECFNVMITDSENTVGLFQPEFATSNDIEGSLNRLISLLEEYKIEK